jgi:hypothetical protein
MEWEAGHGSTAYNPSIWEAEAGGFQVQDQTGLHSETLSSKNKKKKGVGKWLMKAVFKEVKTKSQTPWSGYMAF